MSWLQDLKALVGRPTIRRTYPTADPEQLRVFLARRPWRWRRAEERRRLRPAARREEEPRDERRQRGDGVLDQIVFIVSTSS